MRHMLNTLFVLSEDTYLSLDNENIVINKQQDVVGKIPLHTLEQILYFGYKGASPALMGECTKRGIGMSFYSPYGKFYARVSGCSNGNVLLRKAQYRISDDPYKSCEVAKNFIAGKIYNNRSIIERMKRDHPLNIDVTQFSEVSNNLKRFIGHARTCKDLDVLRGIEGGAAQQYFSIFGQMILRNREAFSFLSRQKRPPLGRVNALLSYVYTLLAHDCGYALEGVGLDAYVGFLHRDKPGRMSLALDLMEELRGALADRFVLSLINNRIIQAEDFYERENGVMLLSGDGRKKLLGAWQEKKREQLTHPFLKEKMPWGLVPYAQALVLSRYIRGDIEEYPAFFWK